MTTTEDRIYAAAMRLFVEKGSTQITVSELAQEANLARGTLYRNLGSIDGLFDRVVGAFSADVHQRVAATFHGIDDSATRMANGIRMWVRYAHENPLMGRFAVMFGLSQEAFSRTWMTGQPQRDIASGIASGRYSLGDLNVDSVASLIQGATISAMWMVLEGHQTWRGAGAATAELVLRALGVAPDEARAIAALPLPAMPPHG